MAAHSHQSIFLGVELFAADLCAVMFVAQGERHTLLNELATRPAPYLVTPHTSPFQP